MKKAITNPKIIFRNLPFQFIALVWLWAMLYIVSYKFGGPYKQAGLFLVYVFLIAIAANFIILIAPFRHRKIYNTIFNAFIAFFVFPLIVPICFIVFGFLEKIGLNIDIFLIFFKHYIMSVTVVNVIFLSWLYDYEANSTNKPQENVSYPSIFYALFHVCTLLGAFFVSFFGGIALMLFSSYALFFFFDENKSKKTIIIFAIIACAQPYFFFYGTEKGREFYNQHWGDKCYKNAWYDGKGPNWYVKDDLVCEGSSNSSIQRVYKTLEGADAKTYEKVGRGYYKDKNHIYYHHKMIDADVETFKHENDVFSDKNGIWEKGKIVTGM